MERIFLIKLNYLFNYSENIRRNAPLASNLFQKFSKTTMVCSGYSMDNNLSDLRNVQPTTPQLLPGKKDYYLK